MRSLIVFNTPFSSFHRSCRKTMNCHSELSKVNTRNSFYISIMPTSFKKPEENGTLNVMPKGNSIKVGFSWGKDTFWIKFFARPRNPSCLMTSMVNLGKLSEGPVQYRCIILGYIVVYKSCVFVIWERMKSGFTLSQSWKETTQFLIK